MRTRLSTIVLAWSSAAACALAADDPFAGVVAVPASNRPVAAASATWSDNLLVRREVYLLTGLGHDGDAWESANRWSAGFEAQKRFSTPTRTLASLDYQGRVVYRDPGPAMSADPMAADSGPWEYETHNAYLDLYNVLGAPGRVNLRAGHFYQPFGLNTQTDTHGTLLQLSNERVFGSEREGPMANKKTLKPGKTADRGKADGRKSRDDGPPDTRRAPGR